MSDRHYSVNRSNRTWLDTPFHRHSSVMLLHGGKVKSHRGVETQHAWLILFWVCMCISSYLWTAVNACIMIVTVSVLLSEQWTVMALCWSSEHWRVSACVKSAAGILNWIDANELMLRGQRLCRFVWRLTPYSIVSLSFFYYYYYHLVFTHTKCWNLC